MSKRDKYALELAKNLNRELERKKMTRTELAEKSGLDKMGLSRILNGDGNPRLTTLVKIMGALPVKFEKLVSV